MSNASIVNNCIISNMVLLISFKLALFCSVTLILYSCVVFSFLLNSFPIIMQTKDSLNYFPYKIRHVKVCFVVVGLLLFFFFLFSFFKSNYL